MRTRVTRRSMLKTGAAGAVLAAPFVRGAHAAGSLRAAFWDHWVPGANKIMEKLVRDWAEKEKIEVSIDFISNIGDKLLITIAAERQARSGHDILPFPTWQPPDKAEDLEPMDDLMTPLLAEHGQVGKVVEYLGKQDGRWVALPTSVGSQAKPPCARIDLMQRVCDLDIRRMYPAGGSPDKELTDRWTWDYFLQSAEKCFKAGVPFGLPLGQTADAVDWVGAVFASYGADMVDAKGEIAIKSDATRQVLAWFQKLVPFLPPEVFAWDDASNNKWLIAGKGALIMNPPSAWAVAKRDAPKVAEQLWTFPSPRGPKGRYDPFLPYFWAVWKFSPNKSAAKGLLSHLSQRPIVEQLVQASQGYDIPPFPKMRDFTTWAEEGPPKGSIYNYPPRHDDQLQSLAAAPAPPRIGVQIYTQALMTKTVAQCTQKGLSIDQAIDWASGELEGYMRS